MHRCRQVEGATVPIRLHGVVEATEGCLSGIGLMANPMNRQRHAQTPEHGQIPNGIERADPTLVLKGNDVETLMQLVLDAPIPSFVAQ